MKIERIEEMRLTAADEAALATLLDIAFRNISFDGRSYFQNRHHVRFVVRDGAEIIGHMALGLRAIRMGDELVQAAGLAEVATAPAQRGEGIATALLQAVVAEAKASPADFLVLFGDAPLYAAAGFVAKPNQTLTISMHGVRTGVEERRTGDGFMVMQLREIPWDDDAAIDLVGFAF